MELNKVKNLADLTFIAETENYNTPNETAERLIGC